MALILLIDDDSSLRGLLQMVLSTNGHSVIEASNGRDGLELFSVAEPDLVITDIVMPEMEGIEVMIELRKNPRGAKIIAMSGGGRQGAMDYLRIAQLLGAGKVIVKPFANTTLLAAVEELLAGSESVRPIPVAASTGDRLTGVR